MTGVETGVRNEADVATDNVISTGTGETPNASADSAAIGIRIRQVAVFEITTPSKTPSAKTPASRTRGEPSPTTSTSVSAISCAAPVT